VLYLYEDFLRVFDPEAVRKYGVYFTPPELVQLIVAEIDRALQRGLAADGLVDPNVNLLDPACGTGTFLIAGVSAVAATVAAKYGEGAVGAEVSAFAQRMHGFELLVGPYTVAHYRVLREVLGCGGVVERLPIHLTDTLAPPIDAAGVEPHLAFLSALLWKSDVPLTWLSATYPSS
jgi:predicted helicase